MMYLADIVDFLNKNWKGVFPKGAFYGLSQPRMVKQSVYSPGVVIGSEVKFITPDLNDITVYHKIATSQYAKSQGNSYGDSNGIQHIYDIDVFIFSDSVKTRASAEEIELALTIKMPDSLKVDGFSYAGVSVISSNHNTRALFSSEYQGVDYFLKPQTNFFSIRYRVDLRYQKDCISLCHCNETT